MVPPLKVIKPIPKNRKKINPSISARIQAELSLNPKRVMQFEAMKQRQQEVEQYQSAVREARARQAREQMEQYKIDERIARAEYEKEIKKNLEKMEEIFRRLKLPKELKGNVTFMRNYKKELLNVLMQFGEAENALKNPRFIGAINSMVIGNIKRMGPMEKRMYLGNKNNFVSFLAKTTESVIEQMQG
ncbi:MAG TPA: hypothetical protein PKK60_03520 [archaeon]|nr:hypothetical protein [archaeon]